MQTDMQSTNGEARFADDVSRMAALAQRVVDRSVSGGKAQAQFRMSQAEDIIRRNPTGAILTAAGIGFMVGLMLGRR